MSLRISKVDIWQGQIPDKPGTLGNGLADLAQAGADLNFALARRNYDEPGKSIVFVTPLKGAKQIKAASAAGLKKIAKLQAIRVEGTDRAGLAGEVAATVGQAGVNIRGLTGTVLGKQVVIHILLDSKADATKAFRALNKLQ
jgi:hypothetical protein